MEQSSAHKLLLSQYRGVLRRMAVENYHAQWPAAVLRRLLLSHVEPLERRVLCSAAPVGTELLVNSTTPDTQRTPAIAVDLSGDTIAAWASYNQDGSGWGIIGCKFDS